jgi:hypothetical protein
MKDCETVMILGLHEGTITGTSTWLTQITALRVSARAKSVIMSADDSQDLRSAAQASGHLCCSDILTKNGDDTDINSSCCALV